MRTPFPQGTPPSLSGGFTQHKANPSGFSEVGRVWLVRCEAPAVLCELLLMAAGPCAVRDKLFLLSGKWGGLALRSMRFPLSFASCSKQPLQGSWALHSVRQILSTSQEEGRAWLGWHEASAILCEPLRVACAGRLGLVRCKTNPSHFPGSGEDLSCAA